MNKKEMIIFAIIVVVLVLGIIFIKNSSDNDNIINGEVQKKETTNKIATRKENDKFQIYNTDIKNNTGSTKMTATIKNKTTSKTAEQILTIVLLDNKEREIGRMKVTVPSLEAGSSTEIVSESLTVFENINDFRIE